MSGATTTETAPDAQTLTQIIGDVFVGLLGQDIDARGPREPALPMTAVVTISGECRASVEFACSEDLARRVAAVLFGIPADDVGAADLGDVIGELVNVIGGNVKSVLPGPSVLSLPSTSLSGAWQAPSSAVETAVHLAWHGEPMRISVWSEPAVPGDSTCAKERHP